MAITIGGGFRISDANPIDDRFVVSASSDRFLTEQARVFEGLTVYSSESNDYFILGDKANYDNANGWHKVFLGDLGKGETLTLSGSITLTGSLLVSGTLDFTGSISTISDITASNVSLSGDLTVGGDLTANSDLTASGDLMVFKNSHISKSIFVSESINVTETAPGTILIDNTGSFRMDTPFIGTTTGSIFIVSTSAAFYEFHATSSTLGVLPANRPNEGIWYYPTGSPLGDPALNSALSLKNIISGVLAGGTPSLGGLPDPPVFREVSVFSDGIRYTSSFDYLTDSIQTFFRTSSSPNTNTLISTGSEGKGKAFYSISSSGDAFIKGDIIINSGSRLKTDEIACVDYPVTQSFIHLKSPLISSGNIDALGNFSLPNIPDVSSSLAAAIEGAGNLNTVLTNGNESTIGIEINNSGIAFSGSGGTIIGRSLEAQDAVTSSVISASGNITANTLTLNNLSDQSSEATAVVINGSKVVGTRELGSNAFNSTTVGTTTNPLTVDDVTLRLDTGTTFNGSNGRTISIRDGGVDSDALAADIKVTSLTASIISASNISASNISASNMDLISGSFGRITASNVVTTNLTTNNFTLTSDLTVNGTLNATQFQVASDDASIDSSGNYIGVGANFKTLNVGDTGQPGFQWHLTNGTVDGFATADQAGVKLVTISGSTVRAHTGLIVDASASYVGLIANEDQGQDIPLLIARQESGNDKEVVITGSAFKIIGTDGTQTFNSNGANGTLTIGNTSKEISIRGSAINFTGSANFLNDITVGTLKATTKVTASVIESTGRIDAEGRLSGSKLLLPQDDGNYVRGIFFNANSSVDGRITDDNTDLLIGYNDTDAILLNDSKVQIDVKTNINSSLTSSTLQVTGDTTINGTLFTNGAFSPTSININGGDFEVNSDGALTNSKTASFTGGISSSYFRTIPAGAVDSLKISNNLISAEGSQSMGIQFDGSQKALRFFGGKTDAYVSHSVKIYGPDSGRSTFLLMSGSDFILEESDGGECFNFRGDTGDIILGRSGGSGNILTVQSANTKITSTTLTISSSTFNIFTGSQTTDPDSNPTAILVADIVTGRVYTRNSASYALNALSSSFSSTAASSTNATSASFALTASFAANASTPTLQQVMDEGSSTTIPITASSISSSGVIVADSFRGTATTASFTLGSNDGLRLTTITASLVSSSGGFVGDLTGTASRATIANSVATAPTLAQVTAQGATTNRNIVLTNSANALSASGDIIASSFTGSLLGTASVAVSSSYALTASFAANASTPTLQQVMDEGSSTTTSITASAISASANIEATSITSSFRGGININSPSILANNIEYGDIGVIATSKTFSEVVKFGTTDGSLTAGMLYALHSDGKWKLADATSEVSSSTLLGVALTTNVTDGFILKGMCTITYSSATGAPSTGSALYLSNQPGKSTHIPTSGSNQVIRAIGYNLDNGRSYFNPDSTYIVAS